MITPASPCVTTQMIGVEVDFTPQEMSAYYAAGRGVSMHIVLRHGGSCSNIVTYARDLPDPRLGILCDVPSLDRLIQMFLGLFHNNTRENLE